MERLPPADLDSFIDQMLASDPTNPVMAVTEAGRLVPVPEAVPLGERPVMGGAVTPLQLVEVADRPVVLEIWERARTRGAARGMVRMPGAGAPVDLQFLDARHRYGVYLVFLVGTSLPTEAQGAAIPEVRSRQGVTCKDELSLFTACDASFCRMLGFSEAELVGRRSLELIHPDDHPRAIESWLDLLARPNGSNRVRLRHQRQDGSFVWLEITNTNYLDDPQRGFVLGECVDITEEMLAAEGLRASEELLRRLTQALPVGVLQLDPAAVVVYRNDRVEAVLDRPVPPGACLEDIAAALGPSGDALLGAVTAALWDGQDSDLELVLDRGQGGTRHLQLAVRALSGQDGASGPTGAIACLTDVTEEARLREELAHRATYDVLTGCLSRRALIEKLDVELARGVPVTALFVDLDGFKEVNDRYGHAIGDALLVHVSARLLDHVEDRGFVGRLGGDEFLVVLPGIGTTDEAEIAALTEAIGVPFLVDGVRLVARASIGVARSGPGTPADALIAAADELMYRCKTRHRRAAGH